MNHINSQTRRFFIQHKIFGFCKEFKLLWCVCVCSPDLEVRSVGPEHIAVKRFAHFIYRRLPPASSVITKRAVLTGRGTRKVINTPIHHLCCF